MRFALFYYKDNMDDLIFEAIKSKCNEDEDGEMTLVFKVSLKDKISAIAIPVKKLLKIKVEIVE